MRAEDLRRERRKAGVRQAELAEELGIAPSALSFFETEQLGKEADAEFAARYRAGIANILTRKLAVEVAS